MAFPELPAQVRKYVDQYAPGFWNWYQDALQYWRRSAVAVEGLPLPSGSVVSETSFGQASGAGASDNYSRADHTHGTPAAPDLDGHIYDSIFMRSPDGTVWELTVEDDGSLLVTEV